MPRRPQTILIYTEEGGRRWVCDQKPGHPTCRYEWGLAPNRKDWRAKRVQQHCKDLHAGAPYRIVGAR